MLSPITGGHESDSSKDSDEDSDDEDDDEDEELQDQEVYLDDRVDGDIIDVDDENEDDASGDSSQNEDIHKSKRSKSIQLGPPQDAFVSRTMSSLSSKSVPYLKNNDVANPRGQAIDLSQDEVKDMQAIATLSDDEYAMLAVYIG